MPVYPPRLVRMPSGMSAWLVTSYPDARLALADPRFAKDSARVAALVERQVPHGGDGRFRDSLAHHMLNTDPPEHGRLRRLVAKAFTTRRVAGLRPRISEITTGLLDAVAGRAEVDMVAALALPLPIAVICELLAIPHADRDAFRSWSNTLVSAHSGAPVSEASTAVARYLAGLVETKRNRPGHDLLSALVAPEADEDRLSEPELIAMVVLLLAAGHETTVNLIGNGILALLTNPWQYAALRADRSLLPNAIEEFLRYDGPVSHATLRFTTEPVPLGGVVVPAGELVLVSIDAADHDPLRFPAPQRVDLTRETTGHLAFGHGIHHCLGAPLARLEAEIAFGALLDRFAGMELAIPASQLRWQASTVMRGLERLPVRLTSAS
jgi:cytochrome P450